MDFDLNAYNEFVNIDELLEKLKELSYSTNRHGNKKDRNKQKGILKDVLRSIEVTFTILCFVVSFLINSWLSFLGGNGS